MIFFFSRLVSLHYLGKGNDLSHRISTGSERHERRKLVGEIYVYLLQAKMKGHVSTKHVFYKLRPPHVSILSPMYFMSQNISSCQFYTCNL